jgi:SPP1 gp7 family putative phage head morphogenesis protein
MISFRSLPFDEAIKSFRDRTVLTPDKYNQLTAEAKAKAFTVAGGTRMDVLTDIHSAIDRAVAGGTTFSEFKKSMKETMAKRGWEGLSPYRLDTIFRTNIQAAYQAGHYQRQMEVADSHPYWQYVAVMDSRTRPAHAVMNGRTLRHDDPFWSTSYPPNGFNCRCTVRALTKGEISREKLSVEDDVPGIADPGFAGNPGQAYRTDFIAWEKAQRAPEAVRGAFVASMVESSPRRAAFSSWIDGIVRDGKARGSISVVGWMDLTTMEYLEKKKIAIASPVIIANDRGMLHAARTAKQIRGNALTPEELKMLPDIVANSEAILWDTQDPALLYVVTDRDRKIKVVTRVNYRLKGASEPVNIIATAGRVLRENLTGGRYELIRGEL